MTIIESVTDNRLSDLALMATDHGAILTAYVKRTNGYDSMNGKEPLGSYKPEVGTTDIRIARDAYGQIVRGFNVEITKDDHGSHITNVEPHGFGIDTEEKYPISVIYEINKQVPEEHAWGVGEPTLKFVKAVDTYRQTLKLAAGHFEKACPYLHAINSENIAERIDTIMRDINMHRQSNGISNHFRLTPENVELVLQCAEIAWQQRERLSSTEPTYPLVAIKDTPQAQLKTTVLQAAIPEVSSPIAVVGEKPESDLIKEFPTPVIAPRIELNGQQEIDTSTLSVTELQEKYTIRQIVDLWTEGKLTLGQLANLSSTPDCDFDEINEITKAGKNILEEDSENGKNKLKTRISKQRTAYDEGKNGISPQDLVRIRLSCAKMIALSFTRTGKNLEDVIISEDALYKMIQEQIKGGAFSPSEKGLNETVFKYFQVAEVASELLDNN